MNADDDNGPALGGDDAVAAEYVLGVLDADERAAASRRIDSEPDFARLVERWEARLAPMANAYAEAPPSASVKLAIDQALFPSRMHPQQAAGSGFWSSLAFWRSLAVAALAALAVAIALPLLSPQPVPEAGPRLVASLAPQQSDVHYFVVYDARSRDIGLSHVTGARQDGRDFELWVIEGGQPPASLGIIPAGESVHMAVSDDMRRKLAAGAVFAISVEPAGGSPTGQPTGPVVSAGDLRNI